MVYTGIRGDEHTNLCLPRIELFMRILYAVQDDIVSALKVSRITFAFVRSS